MKRWEGGSWSRSSLVDMFQFSHKQKAREADPLSNLWFNAC